MKKRMKILIICISSILIVTFIVLVIMNYIVLPPKVSASSQKYRFNHNNMLNLKSITVDGNKVIYEFSSLNKYFHKNFIKKRGKETEYTSYLELHEVINTDTNESVIIYPEKYSIITSFTSIYLVITLKDTDTPDFIRSNYKGGFFNKFDSMAITLNNTEGYEKLKIAIRYDYPNENQVIGKSQVYDSDRKKWGKVKKGINYFSPVM